MNYNPLQYSFNHIVKLNNMVYKFKHFKKDLQDLIKSNKSFNVFEEEEILKLKYNNLFFETILAMSKTDSIFVLANYIMNIKLEMNNTKRVHNRSVPEHILANGCTTMFDLKPVIR